ncbi:MAG: hypothetical protein IT580_09310 [Verrucomicrobiales bacterium]|nr:hypothetical protein [Verrucomicrobiales bacterium]
MRAPGQGTKLKDGRWKTVVTLPDGRKFDVADHNDALAAAGIWDGAVQPPEGLPPLYSLRKARIELWGDMGVSDEVWAKLAGHSDPDLTRRVYDRVSESRIAAQLGLGVPPSVSRETPKKRI